jgi:hypothetical protein
VCNTYRDAERSLFGRADFRDPHAPNWWTFRAQRCRLELLSEKQPLWWWQILDPIHPGSFLALVILGDSSDGE